jgi:hypothetical protein
MLRVCVAVLVAGGVCALGEARLAGQERKKAAGAPGGTVVKGTLAGADAGKNTVTVTVHTFNRATQEATDTDKTFALADGAKVLQDDAAAKLGDLKKGNPVVVALAGEKAAGVSVDGGTAQGEFRSANADRNTIVVIAGRNMERRTFHLLRTTKVTDADGKDMPVASLKPGAKLTITRSVEDDNTAIRVQQLPAGAPKRER